MKLLIPKGLLFGLLLLLGTILPCRVLAQTDSVQSVSLEHRISRLEHRISSHADKGLVVFLFGAVCALWAQNTRRNAWLWFFLGLFFNLITMLVLLHKNRNDRKQMEAMIS